MSSTGRDCSRTLEFTVHHGTGDVRAVREEGEGWSRTFLLKHKSMDLVIMNPPFTRPTNHEATAAAVPSFAGLGTEADEQAAMSQLLRQIRSSIRKPGRARQRRARLELPRGAFPISRSSV